MRKKKPPRDELVGDPWPEEEVTRVDRAPEGEVTPVTMPRCTECGRVVFFDDFTQAASAVAAGLFSEDRCVRARDGHWWWCGERWRLIYQPARPSG